RYEQKIRIGGIMGLAIVGLAVLRRCWPRQSSVSRTSDTVSENSLFMRHMPCPSSQQIDVVVVAAEVPTRVPEQPGHPHHYQEHPQRLQGHQPQHRAASLVQWQPTPKYHLTAHKSAV
ncbi:hypothetical protein Tco_1443888, partial [Tanacetum coccineum]